MMLRITDDNWRNFQQQGGILKREIAYGSPQARQRGATPISDDLDVLIPWDEMKERINEANEKRQMAMHHLIDAGARPHNQGRTKYCWAYGLALCVEAGRPLQNMPYRRLGPASLGWLVGWRNRGYYLIEAIKAANQRGFARAELVPDGTTDPRRFGPDWEADALNNRPLAFTDLDRSRGGKSMAQQVASLLVAGKPLYTAYDHLGHAMSRVGVVWDETQKYNLRWYEWNSHGDGLIEMTGSRAIPDEAYGVGSVSFSV